MVQERSDRTLGPGHDTFWEWCAKGELRLQCCESSGNIAWPVVRSCEVCGGTAFEWKCMSGRGQVISWTTFERDYYNQLMDVPYDTILVELEEGPLFLSNPLNVGWRDLYLGMPVSVSFVPCRDSAGLFNLPVFEAV